MSIIKCPECGHEVSTKAPTCPNCGVAIQNNIKRCPICNNLVLMDAEQCPHCSARFLVEKTGPAPAPLATPAAPVAAAAPILAAVSPTASAPEEQPLPTPKEPTAPTPPEAESSGPSTDGTSPTPPKKEKSSPWWLLALAIVMVAVGGFFYFSYRMHEATEEKDYESLKNCTEIENYQDFINRYPESRHIENVRSRLKELQRIENEWRSACNAKDSRQLQDFIDQNPTSVHKSAALFKIDSLDWIEADRKGTAAAYNLYIERHEDGEHIGQAYIERDRASVREAKARLDSINAAQNELRDSLAFVQAGIPAAQ